METAPSQLRAAALLSRQPGVAQAFPWHFVLLSQQPQDGPGLGRAAGWKQEMDFLVGPAASIFLKACPGLVFGLCLWDSSPLGSLRPGERGIEGQTRGPLEPPRAIPCAPLTATPQRTSRTFEGPGAVTFENSRLALRCQASKMPPLLTINTI